MAAVKQEVLNWLYSVLTSVSIHNPKIPHRTNLQKEYKDITRTYNDVAQTLSHYSSISPRTDVYSMQIEFMNTRASG